MIGRPNPLGELIVLYPGFVDAVERFEECFESTGWSSPPLCCACVGASGSGKSSVAKYFAARHPRVDHGEWEEIPVLYTQAPTATTIKRFAETILCDLGDPLYRKGTTIEKTVRIRELFKRCQVKMLLVDETNHFVERRGARVAHEVADWLKSLIDMSAVSVALFGLERCLEVLRQNEQLRRRFSAPFTLGHFDWELEVQQRQFKQFLRSVQKHLVDYEMPCAEDEDFEFKMYYASFGLVGYVTKILSAAISDARRKKTFRITEKCLSDAYRQEVWSIDPRIVNPFSSEFDPRSVPAVVPPSRPY
jgi:hypothetical protein